MSSQRRIAASRANGARSRGPVTPEGKERSALNAVRHGLLARTVVLDDEDPASFETLVSNLITRFQPADHVELALVEEMAAAQWRQRRIWAVEVQLMNDAAAALPASGPVSRITQAFRSLAGGPELTLMHRYEARQNRLYHTALKSLLTLRAEMPNEPNPVSEHSEPAPAESEPAAAQPDAAPADPPAAIPIRPAAEAPAEPQPSTPQIRNLDAADFIPAIELLRSRGLLPNF